MTSASLLRARPTVLHLTVAALGGAGVVLLGVAGVLLWMLRGRQ